MALFNLPLRVICEKSTDDASLLTLEDKTRFDPLLISLGEVACAVITDASFRHEAFLRVAFPDDPADGYLSWVVATESDLQKVMTRLGTLECPSFVYNPVADEAVQMYKVTALFRKVIGVA